MASIAELAVQLTANAAPFRKGMTEAKVTLTGFSDTIHSVQSKLAGILGALGVGLSVAGIAKWIESSGQAINQTYLLAKAIGISTEALSSYHAQADDIGISTEDLDAGLRKFAAGLGKAAAGADGADKIFRALGLDARQLADMPLDDALKVTADQFSKLGTQAEKAAAAQLLMGKGGVAMINFLDQGSKGLQEMQDETAALGKQINSIDAQMIHNAALTFSDMKDAVSAIGEKLAIELAPIMISIVNKFNDAATAGDGWGKKVVNAIQWVTNGLSYLADGWQVLSIAMKTGQALALTTFKLMEEGLALPLRAIQALQKAMGKKPIDTSEFDNYLKGLQDQIDDLSAGINKKMAEPWKHNELRKWWEDVKQSARDTAAQELQDNKAVNDTLDLQLGKIKAIGQAHVVGLREGLLIAAHSTAGSMGPSGPSWSYRNFPESSYIPTGPGRGRIGQGNLPGSWVGPQNVAGTGSTERKIDEMVKALKQIAANTKSPVAVAA